MGSSHDTYSQKGSDAATPKSALPLVAVITIACAGVLAFVLAGLYIWSYSQKRDSRRADLLSLPHTSKRDPSAQSPGPQPKTSLSSSHLGSSSSNVDHIPDSPPHSKFCEEFDFSLPVLPAANTNEPMSYSRNVSLNLQQEYGSPFPWAQHNNNTLADIPKHLTFVPRVLLTGNLLQLKPAVTPHPKPRGFNSHDDRVIIRPLPQPGSCSNDLQELIEQVNLRIFEDFDEDETFTASTISSNPSSNPASPSMIHGECMPSFSLPLMTDGSPLYLPLPSPRCNDRTITPIRRSLSYLHSSVSYTGGKSLPTEGYQIRDDSCPL